MVKNKENNEKIERVTLKLPKNVAMYFRQAFSHGKRSNFVARCILDHKHQQEITVIEEQLRKVGKKRQ